MRITSVSFKSFDSVCVTEIEFAIMVAKLMMVNFEFR